MEYTGKFRTVNSKKYGPVYIMEYKSESKMPYCECSRCGKDIKKIMYVVQDSRDIEVEYLGSDCIKYFE